MEVAHVLTTGGAAQDGRRPAVATLGRHPMHSLKDLLGAASDDLIEDIPELATGSAGPPTTLTLVCQSVTYPRSAHLLPSPLA